MKPVEQTRLTWPDGNCFAACIASIFEVSLEDVMDYMGDDWHEKWNEWLAQYNITLIHWEIPEGQQETCYKPPCYYLLGADSPRGDWIHSVVAKGDEIMWDPHPQRDMGVKRWRDITIFAVIDPSKPIGVLRKNEL